jgi:hypothetical protein
MKFIPLLHIVLLTAMTAFSVEAAETRSKDTDGFSHFVAVKKFSKFKKSSGAQTNETVLTSPVFSAPISWNELVVSWNADAPPGSYLKIEARGIYPDHSTKFYTMGLWSEDPKQFPRESVRGQKDADGNVDTDTLILNAPGAKAQVRITLGASDKTKPALKFLGLSFCNTKANPAARESNHNAWGKETAVIERSQNSYPGEQGWCSATSLSMILTHWSDKLSRREMAVDVPEVVTAIEDRYYGTGNWPFNTAYAGHFKDMRAYVTRLGDISELEEWTSSGFPVVISAPWHLLKPGRKNTGGGHVVLCTGFTENGDVVINDPGTNVKVDRVRHVFKREDVINAWSKSHNTVYLIYPESAKIPKDELGHWERK